MQSSSAVAPHADSVPGDFYVENACCTLCGVPQMVAPNLIGVSEEKYGRHCFWKKQPESTEELKQAFMVLDQQELGCHRYAGDDPAILAHISPENCDRPDRSQYIRSTALGTATDLCLFRQGSEDGLLQRLWKRLRGK